MTDADLQRYQPGDSVRVRVAWPETHHRAPGYIKGKAGMVQAVCGVFHDPESRAYGGAGLPRQPLYRVRFKQIDVWNHYEGSPGDIVLIDVYQNWLEPA